MKYNKNRIFSLYFFWSILKKLLTFSPIFIHSTPRDSHGLVVHYESRDIHELAVTVFSFFLGV